MRARANHLLATAGVLVGLFGAVPAARAISPTDLDALDDYILARYADCWSAKGRYGPSTYVPAFRVDRAPDGRLSAPPVLLNPPLDPRFKPLVDSARQALAACDPMPMPARYAGFYDAWRRRTVRFDPQYVNPAETTYGQFRHRR